MRKDFDRILILCMLEGRLASHGAFSSRLCHHPDSQPSYSLDIVNKRLDSAGKGPRRLKHAILDNAFG